MHFGEKIKLMRKKSRLTQRDLSARSGIYYTMICKYENGDIMPSIEAVKKIADALGISLNYLMYDEQKDRPERMIHDKELLSLFENGTFLVKEFVGAMIKKQNLERIMQE